MTILVVDRSGSPLSDAEVRVYKDGFFGGKYDGGRSNRDGKFELEYEGGKYDKISITVDGETVAEGLYPEALIKVIKS